MNEIVEFLYFNLQLGVCSKRNCITANIVLAGDPMHFLDVVFKSNKNATKLDLKVSLMERLFYKSAYQPDPETMKYNSECITQLIKNYPSHKEEILFNADELFYNEKLKGELN